MNIQILREIRLAFKKCFQVSYIKKVNYILHRVYPKKDFENIIHN